MGPSCLSSDHHRDLGDVDDDRNDHHHRVDFLKPHVTEKCSPDQKWFIAPVPLSAFCVGGSLLQIYSG